MKQFYIIHKNLKLLRLDENTGLYEELEQSEADSKSIEIFYEDAWDLCRNNTKIKIVGSLGGEQYLASSISEQKIANKDASSVVALDDDGMITIIGGGSEKIEVTATSKYFDWISDKTNYIINVSKTEMDVNIYTKLEFP